MLCQPVSADPLNVESGWKSLAGPSTPRGPGPCAVTSAVMPSNRVRRRKFAKDFASRKLGRRQSEHGPIRIDEEPAERADQKQHAHEVEREIPAAKPFDGIAHQ